MLHFYKYFLFHAMKRFLLFLLLFALPFSVYAADEDQDGIDDSNDICLDTPLGELVDLSGSTRGCSESQKQLDIDGDGTPDIVDTDDDNDGLSDAQELAGWTIQIPFYDQMLDFQVTSNPYLIDTDGDGLSDLQERNRRLHPLVADTDGDGVIDNIDTQITPYEQRFSVNTSGVYTPSVFDNGDEDGDGIRNADDRCLGTPRGETVYTSGAQRGCSTRQNVQSQTDSDFDGVPDTLDACNDTKFFDRTNVGSNGCVVASNVSNLFSVSYSSSISANNISIGGRPQGDASNVRANDKLMDFNEEGQFIEAATGGERGIYNTLIRFARDLKNLFYAIATVFFLIISLRLILASNAEEEVENFKKGIIWITIGIIVMQIAYSLTLLLFDQGVSAQLGASLLQNVVYPLLELLQTLASFFFIGMAIYAFYRLVSANGNEEAIKSGKMTIVYALIGFLIVRFARAIVEAFYGRIYCESYQI